MYEWQQIIQTMIDEIDESLINHHSDQRTLHHLAKKLGYSEYYTTRKFKAVTGMSLRDYLKNRKLAFALKAVRDGNQRLLNIALDFGFSSHEAFTRAFKKRYGITPSAYRKNPRPLVLRTKISPIDYYFLKPEMAKPPAKTEIRIYFVTIPAHAFLHIRNYQSNGYWDFWQKQNQIPNQDQKTICGILDSIKGKLDDQGGTEVNGSAGQIMAYLNDPHGRLCDWGVRRVECWGVRLPIDQPHQVPTGFQITDIPEGEYIVFEHGPFDYVQENALVEAKIEHAMATFDYAQSGYCLDTSPGRIMYFYYDPHQYFKYIRPIRRVIK